MSKKRNRIGGGIFKHSKTIVAISSLLFLGLIGIAVYNLFETPFEGPFLSFDTVVVASNVSMIFVCAYWVYLLLNPYNTIYWDDEYLTLIFKSRKETVKMKRADIAAVDLKLNEMTITGTDGSQKSYNIYDMHISYSEINRFRREFAG